MDESLRDFRYVEISSSPMNGSQIFAIEEKANTDDRLEAYPTLLTADAVAAGAFGFV